MELKNYVVFKAAHGSYGYLIVKAGLSTPEFGECAEEVLKTQLNNYYFDGDLKSLIDNPDNILTQSDTLITEQTHPELFI